MLTPHLMVSAVIDGSYGLIKALRLLKKCGARPLGIDSLNSVVRFEVPVESLGCLAELRGFFVIEPRLVLISERCVEVLKSLGFVMVRGPTSHRIELYKECGNVLLIVQRTSRKGVYLVRCCRGRRFTAPLPMSACTFTLTGALEISREGLGTCVSALTEIGAALDKSLAKP